MNHKGRICYTSVTKCVNNALCWKLSVSWKNRRDSVLQGSKHGVGHVQQWYRIHNTGQYNRLVELRSICLNAFRHRAVMATKHLRKNDSSFPAVFMREKYLPDVTPNNFAGTIELWLSNSRSNSPRYPMVAFSAHCSNVRRRGPRREGQLFIAPCHLRRSQFLLGNHRNQADRQEMRTWTKCVRERLHWCTAPSQSRFYLLYF